MNIYLMHIHALGILNWGDVVTAVGPILEKEKQFLRKLNKHNF